MDRPPQPRHDGHVFIARVLGIQIFKTVEARAQHFLQIRSGVRVFVAGVLLPFPLDEGKLLVERTAWCGVQILQKVNMAWIFGDQNISLSTRMEPSYARADRQLSRPSSCRAAPCESRTPQVASVATPLFLLPAYTKTSDCDQG